MNYQTILLAAGNSTRSTLNYNKVFYLIDNKPIITLSASNFLNDDRCDKIFLVCKENEIESFKNIFNNQNKIVYVIGGKTRQESVSNALKLIDKEYVLIHDGARPFVSKELIDNVLIHLNNNEAVIPVIKLTDTIKLVKDNKVVKTLNREELVRVQTPQGFKTNVIKKAHNLAIKNDYSDDSSMVEAINVDVYTIEGEINNTKFTIKEDF